MLCLHPCFCRGALALPLTRVISERVQGVDMPGTSPDCFSRATRSGPSFGDDQIFAKLHSVGIQAALSVLLSLFGLGPAMAHGRPHEDAAVATRDGGHQTRASPSGVAPPAPRAGAPAGQRRLWEMNGARKNISSRVPSPTSGSLS